MANTAQQFIVDPLDAEFALSELQGIMQARGMSTTDLAVELGWKRKKVDEFFHCVDFPTYKEFKAVAEALEYELDFSEE